MRIHRLLISCVDDNDAPRSMREISSHVEQITDVQTTVIYHDWRDVNWNGGPPVPFPEMTADQLNAWFSAARSGTGHEPPLTVQTALSLINLARPGTPGRQWLIDRIVPSLQNLRLYEAQANIADRNALDPANRTPLVDLVFDIINDILVRQEQGTPLSLADCRKSPHG